MMQEEERYQRKQILGEGTYGEVFRAINRKTSQVVALKKIKLESSDEGVPSTAMRQISILKQLQPHPNIVDLKQIIYKHTQRKLYLIFEYVESDLKKYLFNNRKTLTLDQAKLFMFQLINGVHFCHSRRIIHRDLKPQNILIDKNGCLKIADFGLARAFGIPLKTLSHEIQTLWYRAPEVLLGQKHYSLGVDIWAVGCIFAQILMKKPFFAGDCEIDQIFKIFQFHGTPTNQQWPDVNKLPDFKTTFPKFKKKDPYIYFNGISSDAIDLLLKMVCLNPSDRISMKQALKHQYFKGISSEIRLSYMG